MLAFPSCKWIPATFAFVAAAETQSQSLRGSDREREGEKKAKNQKVSQVKM